MQQTLLRRADGNPLFAEEYIRMLRDRGLLRKEGGSWRLDQADVDVPETVQGIIAARLDALEQDEKEVLQTASVVGKVFWLGSVAAIAGISAWEAEERLHALERKEFVRRDRRASVAGETEYAVRHVLVRDVAYGQIPRARRADLHVRAAKWIESLGQDRSEDRAEMLAHHYVAALNLTRAAGGDTAPLEAPARQALREAGKRAYALSALESAANLYARALELWPKDDPAHPHLLLELGKTLLWMRNEGAPELEQAAARLLSAGDVESAAEAESLLADVHWVTGAQEVARKHYERSVVLIADLPETRATAKIRSGAWRNDLLANKHPSMQEGKRILGLMEVFGSTEEILNTRITVCLGHADHGDPHATIRDLELALDQCLEAKSFLAARALLNLASFVGTVGDLRRSAELHREGVEVARRFGSFQEHWLVAECAIDDYTTGAWDAAIVGASAFLEHGGAAQYMEVGARAVLAATFAARGSRREADEHAGVMLARAREIGDPQALWGSLGECARLATETGERGEAQSLVQELAATLSAAESFQIEVHQLGGFVAAAALGLGHELGDHLEKAAYDSPWVDAAAQIAEGRLEEAGDTLHAHEAYSYAAMVRLLAAERAGQETPGLRDAVAFYESVGATAYLARAEALLQATA